MISINYRDNRPIYEQVRDSLRQLITSGASPPGGKLPSVRELAAELAINPNTIQRSLTELEREGLLVSERTAGRFVTENRAQIEELRSTQAEAAASEFREAMNELGYDDREAVEFFRCICRQAGKMNTKDAG